MCYYSGLDEGSFLSLPCDIVSKDATRTTGIVYEAYRTSEHCDSHTYSRSTSNILSQLR